MDKNTGGDINVGGRLYAWFDNFWYHYKWATIGIIFALFVLLVGIMQTCEKESNDVYVMYGGRDTFILESDKVKNIKAALGAVLPEDFNGDGKKQVEWVSSFIMSTEEIQKLKEESIQNGVTDFYVDSALISNNLKNFDSLILAGEYSVCFLSPFLFERVKDAGGLMPLSDIFDEVPDSAVDAYGISLAQTKFGQYYAGINELAPDTVLCIRTVGSINSFFRKGSAEKAHKEALALFRAIVEFEIPDAQDSVVN